MRDCGAACKFVEGRRRTKRGDGAVDVNMVVRRQDGMLKESAGLDVIDLDRNWRQPDGMM
eukprot:767766-Hanusia_phi.AAC.3